MFTLSTFLMVASLLACLAGTVTLGVVVAIRWQAALISSKYLSKLFDTQTEVAQDLDRLQAEHNVRLQQERLKMLSLQRQQMEQVELAAREKLKDISTYFRQSLDSEATTKLMSAAYQFVAGEPTPRNLQESELIQAVVEHEKAGSPNLEDPPSVKGVKERMN